MNIEPFRASKYTDLGDSRILVKRSLDESFLEDNNFKKNRNENAIAMGVTGSDSSSSNHLLERNSFSTSPPKLPKYTSSKVIPFSVAGGNSASSSLDTNGTTISVKTAPPKRVSFADPLITDSFSVLRKESPKQKWDEAYQAVLEAAQEFPSRLKIFLADKEHPDLKYWKPAMKKTFEKSKALFELYREEPTLQKRFYLLKLIGISQNISYNTNLIFSKELISKIHSLKCHILQCSRALNRIDTLLKKFSFTKEYNILESGHFFIKLKIYGREIEDLKKEITQNLSEPNLEEKEKKLQEKELASKEASERGREFLNNALNISLPSNNLKFLAKKIEKEALFRLQWMYNDPEILNILNEFFS